MKRSSLGKSLDCHKRKCDPASRSGDGSVLYHFNGQS